jgi:hypothetical protein
MNIYHPYSSFSHMVREFKKTIGQEGYSLFAPGDPRATSDFLIPVITLCNTLKKKYAQETGLFFETLVDEFEEAFDKGCHSLSFDRDYLTDYIGINPRKASKAILTIIDNLAHSMHKTTRKQRP